MADNTVQAGTDTIATDDVTTLNGGASSGVKVQRVKVMFGDDNTAQDVSAAFPMPTMTPDLTATGTISATDAVVAAPSGSGVPVSGTPTANSYVAFAITNITTSVVQVSGTFGSGSVWFEASANATSGTTGSWVTLSHRTIGTATSVVQEFASAAGVFRGNASGFAWFRARVTGATAPSIAVVLRATDSSGTIALNAAIPTGTNRIGTMGKAPAATGTITSAALSLTSFTILAANTNRLGATFFNDSANIVYLGLTGSAVTTTAYTLQVPPNGYYELPSDGCGYVGQVTGIALVASGNLRVTELTA